MVRGVAGGFSPQTELADIISHDVQSIRPEEDVKQAFDIMQEKQIRRLPVVGAAGDLLGIVSLGDLATRADDAKKAGKALKGISQTG